MVIEFALAVDLAIVASQASILIDNTATLTYNHHIDEHKDWSIAATVFSWIIKLPFLFALVYMAIDSLGLGGNEVEAPAPPPTADRM